MKRFALPIWKRAFDMLFSGLAILVLSPLLLATARPSAGKQGAFLQIETSRQQRPVFDFLKFRSSMWMPTNT
jgi:lipopolysaccharide/colanic/teichoic acid biosynthesis glycosyltransferase